MVLEAAYRLLWRDTVAWFQSYREWGHVLFGKVKLLNLWNSLNNLKISIRACNFFHRAIWSFMVFVAIIVALTLLYMSWSWSSATPTITVIERKYWNYLKLPRNETSNFYRYKLSVLSGALPSSNNLSYQ